MLRNITITLYRQPKSLVYNNSVSCAPFVQQIRWKKRRWAPINASKLFYVPERREPDPVEREELRERYRHYRHAVKSITSYFKKVVGERRAASSTSSVAAIKRRKEEFQQLCAVNEDWNTETAQLREERQAKLEREEEMNRKAQVAIIEERKLKDLIEAQRIVQSEVENSKNFVDPNNLEEEIEKALNMQTSYNVAIDLEGNRYVEKPDGSVATETAKAYKEQKQTAKSV